MRPILSAQIIITFRTLKRSGRIIRISSSSATPAQWSADAKREIAQIAKLSRELEKAEFTHDEKGRRRRSDTSVRTATKEQQIRDAGLEVRAVNRYEQLAAPSEELRAITQIGKISKELEKAEQSKGGRHDTADAPTKTAQLAEAGIKTRTAHRYEELAAPSDDLPHKRKPR